MLGFDEVGIVTAKSGSAGEDEVLKGVASGTAPDEEDLWPQAVEYSYSVSRPSFPVILKVEGAFMIANGGLPYSGTSCVGLVGLLRASTKVIEGVLRMSSCE